MNSVSLIGNLALEPELKKTKSGKDVCTIRIGVTRSFRNENGVREADFINVQCWEQSAKFVSGYMHKGDKIAITGELRERRYTAQDGSQRYTLEVVAEHVEALGGGRGGEARKDTGSAPSTAPARFEEIIDDDLPF